jgi:hypothetical protein
MTLPPSPLLGYNTNIRHKGKLYHIQTEDSGVERPHIITHLFADGGRVVASTKTQYGQLLGSEALQDLVKAKMQQQHKAMLIALRDGHYDESSGSSGAMHETAASGMTERAAEPALKAAIATSTAPDQPVTQAQQGSSDPEALDRAADAKIASSVAFRTRRRRRHRTTGPQDVPSQPPRARKTPDPPPKSVHGSTSRSARKKALDRAMLSYLADEEGEPPSGKR